MADGCGVAAYLPRMAAGAAGGHRLDGGRMAGVGVWAACLPRGYGRSGSVISSPISSAHPIGSAPLAIPSSHHLIGGEGFSFSFPPDPLSPALLYLLAWACSPVPGRGMCGLRYGLRWRACGLLACVPRPPFRSLAAARSLVAICPVSLVPFVPARGVVGRFMGYSARYLVGVGVSQNMPLNGILWLLTGIFGDVVRCLFSALLVVSSSPLCPCFPPSPGGGVMTCGGRVFAGSS